MRFPASSPILRLLGITRIWQNNYFVFREFQYFPWLVVLALGFSLLAALFEGFGVGFILTFLQSLIQPGAEPIKTGITWFDQGILGINAPMTERIYRISALILITTWLRSSFGYLGRLYGWMCQINLIDRLRKRIFEQLQALSLSYFSHTRSGELMNSVTSELQQLQQAFDVISYFIIRGTTLLAYLVSMIWLSWQLSILAILMFGLLSVGLSTLVGRVREASFDRSRANGQLSSILVEFISGIRTVHAFATQQFERQRFYQASNDIAQATRRSVAFSELVEPLAEGAATTILIGILVVASAVLVPAGKLQAASLLTFLFVLFRLMPIVRQVNGTAVKLANFHGSLDNIKKLLRVDDKVYLKNGRCKFPSLRHQIQFQSVEFGYNPQRPVLRGLELTIPKGKMTALVGSSGAGKTTLVDLIPRLYDPTRGRILIDGVDLRTFDITSLRRKIAIVSQDTFIFNTSVRNNIAYGLEQISDQAIYEAARQAHALDFILELPQGFETQLGDRGVCLSGGQRQRIAIARALLRNPEILILDEATSALDSVSERLIQASIEQLATGRTVIAIAHRLSTIVRADQVVVMERGQIVEQGSYQELLAQRGRLWKYHRMQHDPQPARVLASSSHSETAQTPSA